MTTPIVSPGTAACEICGNVRPLVPLTLSPDDVSFVCLECLDPGVVVGPDGKLLTGSDHRLAVSIFADPDEEEDETEEYEPEEL